MENMQTMAALMRVPAAVAEDGLLADVVDQGLVGLSFMATLRRVVERGMVDLGWTPCPICPAAEKRVYLHDGACAAGTVDLRGILVPLLVPPPLEDDPEVQKILGSLLWSAP